MQLRGQNEREFKVGIKCKVTDAMACWSPRGLLQPRWLAHPSLQAPGHWALPLLGPQLLTVHQLGQRLASNRLVENVQVAPAGKGRRVLDPDPALRHRAQHGAAPKGCCWA